MEKRLIGYDTALSLALQHASPLEREEVPPDQATGRVAAMEVRAVVDSPSVNASVKDGYAVKSADLARATLSDMVRLRLVGTVHAGETASRSVGHGQAVRVWSGAPVPDGADAVLAEEFAEQDGDEVFAKADAHSGRNILFKGVDVHCNEVLCRAGQTVTPSIAGRLAAGGVAQVPVHRRPVVGLIATGDEVLLPGRPFRQAALYASNLVMQAAWLCWWGIRTTSTSAGDAPDELIHAIESLMGSSDMIIASGGAWTGDRDFTAKALRDLGAEIVFHRVRMGPGKAVGLAVLDGTPIFMLPGGPPSNEMAFLMVAAPALFRLAGHAHGPLPRIPVRLETTVTGQQDWTQFIHCTLRREADSLNAFPLEMRRRLESMARAQAVFAIPEGTSDIPRGQVVSCFLLDPDVLTAPGFA